MEENKKIDLVYLWVDGNDPKWLAIKQKALLDAGKSVHKSALGGRFDDNDELLFSLRSVEKFMPWINHIYIVTKDQTPKWLNINNPKVSIVSQTSIIPKKYPDFFNSAAIEMFLSKIPGLSEKFIYANDDMILGAPVSPDFFFDIKGNPILILKESRKRKSHSLIGTGVQNARNIVLDATRKKYNMTLSHAFDPYTKTQFNSAIKKFWSELEESTLTPFREPRNIQRLFMTLYNNALGRNTIVLPWRFGKKRLVLHANEPWIKTFIRKIAEFILPVKYDFYDVKNIKKLRKIKPKMFCVNDGEVFAKNIKEIKKLFPKKSKFEK
ncbi:MAG: stealth family protein [Alphaproteobacteria bacterium]